MKQKLPNKGRVSSSIIKRYPINNQGKRHYQPRVPSMMFNGTPMVRLFHRSSNKLTS